MKLSDSLKIKEKLSILHYLQECVLLDMKWLHEGTTLEFTFHYIWDKHNKIKTASSVVENIILRFHAVQELHLRNALHASLLQNMNQIN